MGMNALLRAVNCFHSEKGSTLEGKNLLLSFYSKQHFRISIDVRESKQEVAKVFSLVKVNLLSKSSSLKCIN